LVCDEVQVVNSGAIDLPNVVVDKKHSTIQICGSSKWRIIENLQDLFVSILSHETIHLALLEIQGAPELLDDIGSLSSISRSLKDIAACSRYRHGLIGID
jgi:hypothetical protein